MTILTVPILFLGTMQLNSFLYILLAFILLLLLTIGFCLLSSALNVKYRDVNFFVQALLIIWFYATPIVYSLSVVPYAYMWLWRLNPMTSVIQLMQYGFLNAPPPGIGMLSANIITTFIISILGLFTFQNESKNFDDWI